MLTIALILGFMWVLGMLSSNTMGGLVHVLLLLAIIVVLVRVFQGRRAISS